MGDTLRLIMDSHLPFQVRVSPIFFLGLAVMGGSIEGRVTNSVTGEAVAGAKARFLDRHSYVFETFTDSSGGYRLTGLEDGDYRGEFSKDRFAEHRVSPLPLILDGSGMPMDSRRVRVSGDLPARQNVQLDPWGGLRGRVVDDDGKPVAKVRVEISNVRDGETSTDENGWFAFTDLRPDAYTVVAKPEPKTRMQDGERVGVVPTYYPSATELPGAAAINVGWGADVAGIEIRLRSVPVHRVTGVVLDEAGNPVAKATIKLMGRPGRGRKSLTVTQRIIAPGGIRPTGNGTGFGAASIAVVPGTYRVDGPSREPETARVESLKDGTFEFPAVPSADWRLTAEVDAEDGMPRVGVAPANIAERDLEEIQIRLTAQFSVNVDTDWGGINAPPPIPLGLVTLTPLEGQPYAAGSRDSGGMSIFPGRYLVLAGNLSFTSGGLVAAVLMSGADVLGQTVELSPGASLTAVYRPGVAALRGTVEKGEGATVFLVPRNAGEVVAYREVKCGAGGAFEIGELAAGDYFAVAFDRTDERGLAAADLPSGILPFATSVLVEAGSPASVELRVNKWPW